MSSQSNKDTHSQTEIFRLQDSFGFQLQLDLSSVKLIFHISHVKCFRSGFLKMGANNYLNHKYVKFK